MILHHESWKINSAKDRVNFYVGGYCNLNQELLNQQLEHLSALQSWAPELRNFVSLSERPVEDKPCDLVFEKPTYIVKIDSSENLEPILN